MVPMLVITKECRQSHRLFFSPLYFNEDINQKENVVFLLGTCYSRLSQTIFSLSFNRDGHLSFFGLAVIIFFLLQFDQCVFLISRLNSRVGKNSENCRDIFIDPCQGQTWLLSHISTTFRASRQCSCGIFHQNSSSNLSVLAFGRSRFNSVN